GGNWRPFRPGRTHSKPDPGRELPRRPPEGVQSSQSTQVLKLGWVPPSTSRGELLRCRSRAPPMPHWRSVSEGWRPASTWSRWGYPARASWPSGSNSAVLAESLSTGAIVYTSLIQNPNECAQRVEDIESA